MSTTLEIVDGQIYFDPSTGLLSTVADNRKAAQDLGESLLQDYDPNTDYGSHLRSVALNSIPQAGELFLHYYIADAVQKLQAKQHQDPYLTAAEQIVSITALNVVDVGEGVTAFYIAVSTADGGPDISKIAVKETQLNHQFERF